MDEYQAQVYKSVVVDKEKIVVITGAGGSGKSHVLGEIAKKLHAIAVCPTGTAAENLRALGIKKAFTFHTMFGLETGYKPNGKKFKISQKKAWVDSEIVLCDEASMISMGYIASLIRTCIEGEKQLVICGDPHQLPPVGDEDFSMGSIFRHVPYINGISEWPIHHLKHNHRLGGGSKEYLEMLIALRKGDKLAGRKACLMLPSEPHPKAIRLCCTNKASQEINSRMMPTPFGIIYKRIDTCKYMVKKSNDGIYYCEPVTISKGSLFIDPDKKLSVGGRAVVTKNMWAGFKDGRYLQASNGSTGVIEDIDSLMQEIMIRLDNGNLVSIPMLVNTSPAYDIGPFEYKAIAQAEADKIGEWKSYNSCPVDGGYAITIHKSQGHTYDHAHIEADNLSMLSGQAGLAYVALTRARGGDLGTTCSERVKNTPTYWKTVEGQIHQAYK